MLSNLNFETNIFLIVIISIIAISFIIKNVKFRKLNKKIDDLPFTTLSTSKPGLVKIKGKIKADKLITSKVTNKQCIGYSYFLLKRKLESTYGYSGYERKKYKYRKRRSTTFKVVKTKQKCCDFYFYDNTDQVKILADDLLLSIDSFETERPISDILMERESLLIEDNSKEYVLIGELSLNGLKPQLNKGSDSMFTIYNTSYYNLQTKHLYPMVNKFSFFLLVVVIGILLIVIFTN